MIEVVLTLIVAHGLRSALDQFSSRIGTSLEQQHLRVAHRLIVFIEYSAGYRAFRTQTEDDSRTGLVWSNHDGSAEVLVLLERLLRKVRSLGGERIFAWYKAAKLERAVRAQVVVQRFCAVCRWNELNRPVMQDFPG